MRDLTGQRFHDLTAIRPTPERRFGNVVWVCLCSCGKETRVQANNLRTNTTKSCGCRKSRVATARNISRTKHGQARTYQQSPTYRTWTSMIHRCTNESELLDVKTSALRMRLDRGWSIEATLTTPVKKYRPRS